jgi:beta,beta-carotene 9',10'-dioxygenase
MGYGAGFRSLDEEVSAELGVEGDVPGWLRGTFVRNGPGLFTVGDREVLHWFDGLAMLRAFRFEGGRVTYRNRYLRTDAYERAREGDYGGGFGTAGSLRDSLRGMVLPAEGTDNTNVNVHRLGGRVVALTETPAVTEFDPGTLATVATRRPRTPPGQLTTAHPHHDAERGETVNYVTRFGRRNAYQVYRQPDGSWGREVIATVPARHPAYMHSFGLTPNYVVLTEFPFVVRPWRLLVPGSTPFIERYEWMPERGTRFVVLDRDTGEVVASPRTDAFFAFHHVNAFERGDELVVDLVTFPDPSPVGALYLAELRSPSFEYEGGALTRFRIDLAAPFAGVTSETLYEGGIGLPRHSPAVHQHEHRYVYGQGTQGRRATEFPHELLKIDAATGAVQRFREHGWYFSEPVFVPRPDATTEDDGVVLAVALDSGRERSVLVVLDGSTFAALANAPLPHVLPFDFHGQFLPEF